jgi:hypothetical protein
LLPSVRLTVPTAVPSLSARAVASLTLAPAGWLLAGADWLVLL